MRITTVFKRLLSLQAGTLVRNVEFLAATTTIVVWVARRGRRHSCPHCSFRTLAGYDHDVRDWRHVALAKWRVILRAEIWRLHCPTHGVVTESVPWAAHSSRFTLDFEELVAWCAREMNKTAVTQLLHIAWATVGTIIGRVVARKLKPERLDQLYIMGVDEVSYRKGHRYLTVVADHISRCVAWMGEGKSEAALDAFFDELGPERCDNVLVATMDMSASYIASVKSRAKLATVVFDPFHVVKLGGEALQVLRRAEAREHKGSVKGDVLKGARWSLLKAPENRTEKDELRLSNVSRLNRRVYRGHMLYEELRALYTCGPAAAERHLDAWISWANRSRLKPFTKLAQTLTKYRDGVLKAVRLGISNALSESLNAKIRVLTHRAYGFHSVAALMAMVYLCCGDISLRLPI